MTGARRIAGDDALAELAGAIGEAAARALAKRFGGTTLYVPMTIGDNHPIAVAIGIDAAARLAQAAGGVRLAVPKQAERRARVRELRRAGALTIPAIALETGYSERHVYRIMSADADDRQLDLFGD